MGLRKALFLMTLFLSCCASGYAVSEENVQPLKDLGAIQQVINVVNSSIGKDSPFIPDQKALRVTPLGEFVLSPYGFELYRVYKVDLNGGGKEEYVIVCSGGAMRLFGLTGVFDAAGAPVMMPHLESLFEDESSAADAQMAELFRSGKLTIQESHKVLARMGEGWSDADIGFRKENGKVHMVLKRVQGVLLEPDNNTPYWHRVEGATAEIREYLFETNGEIKLIKVAPDVYLGKEPLFHYQKSFNLPSIKEVPAFMKTMNDEYQSHMANR
ncbi:MAG: hypothetical protein Q8P24_16365 [Desulfobacterales bacterium]|nr:hypothetical protein [Desulfobacterales bacterium]